MQGEPMILNKITKNEQKFKQPLLPQKDKYYGVEFSITNDNILYQFKIWNSESKPMFFLIKENSNIFGHIKPGNVLNMRYYSVDPTLPTECWNTQIEQISNEKNGRFKGHHLVELMILDSIIQDKAA